MSRRIQIAAGAGVALVLLWVFFRQADWGLIASNLARADYRWVGAASLLTLLVMVQRGWRWGYLLRPIKSIGFGPLVACTFMGWAFTTLLPGRVGEVARPVLLGRREGISKSAAFATVVLERLFDVLVVLLILAVYLLFFPLPPVLDGEGAAILAGMRASGIAALAVLVVIVLVLVASQAWPRRTDALIVRVLAWIPGGFGQRLVPVSRKFMEGFAGIKEPRLVVAIVLQSIAIWANVVLTYYLLFFAFDIPAPAYAVLPLVVIVVVGVMVPTPAAVGSFHAAARIGLATLWGVPNELAISYAIISHAMAFIPVTIIGLVLLAREGLSVGALGEISENQAP